MIRNLILDWSGTLVDDLPAVWQATNHVFAQAGLPEFSLARFRSEFRLPFEEFYQRHTPHVPIAQLEIWFHAKFREVQDSVVELPHAREFLILCRERGMRLFLLSTLHHEHFAAQTARNGFDRFLERPYLGVWDKRKKIHELIEENALDPRATLFVGDMQHDIETAKHGGIHSCAVLTGYNDLAQLRASDPDLIVEHLGELRAILERDNWIVRGHNSADDVPGDGHPVATVGALIFNGAGEVLMIRTRKWSNLWGIPGGKIKRGETSEAALRRELLEETGLEIEDIRFVMIQDCINSKEFYRSAHFLLLNYTCRCAGAAQVILNHEAQEFRWMTPLDAMAMELNQPTRRLLEEVSRG